MRRPEKEPSAAAAASRAKHLALALLVVTQFVTVIDGSIVSVALPSIGEHLQSARAGLSWVINAYVLTSGGFLLLGGRLADLLAADAWSCSV
jgi:MFS family permease